MLVMPLFKTPLYISLFRQRDSQTYSVIPPRSEANIATKVVFRRVPTSLDDEQWGTEPIYVTPGVHVSRTLVPHDKWTDVPVRVMNVSTYLT